MVSEYAGDGWFRIRNRHSSLCLKTSGDKIVQAEPDEESPSQLWRFIRTGVRPRVRDIDAPTGVKAESRASSVLLTWDKADATDPTYTVLRSDNRRTVTRLSHATWPIRLSWTTRLKKERHIITPSRR